MQVPRSLVYPLQRDYRAVYWRGEKCSIHLSQGIGSWNSSSQVQVQSNGSCLNLLSLSPLAADAWCPLSPLALKCRPQPLA